MPLFWNVRIFQTIIVLENIIVLLSFCVLPINIINGVIAGVQIIIFLLREYVFSKFLLIALLTLIA